MNRREALEIIDLIVAGVSVVGAFFAAAFSEHDNGFAVSAAFVILFTISSIYMIYRKQIREDGGFFWIYLCAVFCAFIVGAMFSGA